MNPFELTFWIEQNPSTIWIFLIGVGIDLWAANRVEKIYDNPRLYLVLMASIFINILTSTVYFIYDSLFNFSVVFSAILIILLCKVLSEIVEPE